MNQKHGELIGIAVRAKSRGLMQEVDVAEITIENGVMHDFRGKPGERQVTVLAAEDWDAACSDLGKRLPWTYRRANLYVKGIKLQDAKDSIVRLGDVMLLVTGETDPCPRMDEAEPGLMSALKPDWRGGVCCRVIRGGEIATDMPVRIEIQNGE